MVNFVLPKISTVGTTHAIEATDDRLEPYLESSDEPDMQYLAEFAGRACYQSWAKPNPATATNAGYLNNILKQKHFSVIEHSSVSYYIEGVSRSLLAEITRHRHFSFSVLSQRYVDSSDVNFVIPPSMIVDPIAIKELETVCSALLTSYVNLERHQADKGLKKKQARESARSVLPNCTETKFVMTGNLRAWMEFLIKRDNPAAEAEIQRLARDLGKYLANAAPDIFGTEARKLWDDFFAQRVARDVEEKTFAKGDIVTAKGRPGVWEIDNISGSWAGLVFADDRTPTPATLGMEERNGVSHVEIAVKIADLSAVE